MNIDVPARRDLVFSLTGSATLMAVAGAQGLDELPLANHGPVTLRDLHADERASAAPLEVGVYACHEGLEKLAQVHATGTRDREVSQ